MRTILVDASKFDAQNILPGDWPEILAQPMQEFWHRAAFITEGRAKQNAPVDRGHLRDSIKILGEVTPLGAVLGSRLEYAGPMEYGARPHWPPPGALQPWARRHGFPAGPKGDWIVRSIIAKRGIKPRSFMRRAVVDSLNDYGLELERAIEGIVRNIERYWERINFNAT